MNRKPRKVEEPSGSYAAKPAKGSDAPAPKAGRPEVRYVEDVAAEKLTKKIFTERKKLLHRLAQ